MKGRKVLAALIAAVMSFTAVNVVCAEAAAQVKEAALPAPAKIKAVGGEGKVTLSWGKVKGADAYRVYLYDFAKKKYSAYKDVAACKCVVKGLDSGTEYKFRVAALVRENGKYRVQTKSAAVSAAAKSAFTVTSADVKNGVWDTAITHTARGEDRTPQLSWSAVDGAKEYVVYMLDTSAKNWLHWRAYGIKSTHLDVGKASADAEVNEYIGPYPPSGTHDYAVTVFALKNAADSYPGEFNAKNDDIDSIRSALDISGGKPGNIIALANITGTYTYGD